MIIIAHRGGMQKGIQNSPEGVRLAARYGADFVELDVVKGRDGAFHCGHGLGQRCLLDDCLLVIGNDMGLIAHLKGSYQDKDLVQLADQVARYLPQQRVIYASHHGKILRRLSELISGVRLARFGLFPAIIALWRTQPWECCMVNHLFLLKSHVVALKQRGYVVVASCVWDVSRRDRIKRLEVDGEFVNLY